MASRTKGVVVATTALVVLLSSGCSSQGGDASGVSGSDGSQTESQATPGPAFSLSLVGDIGVEGVSPELIENPEGGYLLFVTGLGQTRVYQSDDGESFTPAPSFNVPMGSDYSIIQKPDGNWLLYYVSFDGPPPAPGQPMDPSKATKVVKVSESATLSRFDEGVPTGIKQSKPGPAWGVPDTYMGPDGTYRMMWVDMPEGEKAEVLRTATSEDGVSFVEDDGFVISGGYVDPYVLRAEDGDWVALLSTTPDERRLPQRLFVARSVDGVSWSIDSEPLLFDETLNYLDPTAVESSPGTWTVILSRSEKENALTGPYQYVRATLTEG